jgi:hypothetical protein
MTPASDSRRLALLAGAHATLLYRVLSRAFPRRDPPAEPSSEASGSRRTSALGLQSSEATAAGRRPQGRDEAAHLPVGARQPTLTHGLARGVPPSFTNTTDRLDGELTAALQPAANSAATRRDNRKEACGCSVMHGRPVGVSASSGCGITANGGMRLQTCQERSPRHLAPATPTLPRLRTKDSLDRRHHHAPHFRNRPNPSVRPRPSGRPLSYSRRSTAGYTYATASVVRPRLAEGCFSPTMRKPSRSRLEASAALLLLGGVGPDVRPGAIVPPWLSA